MAIYTIQLKRGKSTSWNSLNLILSAGEPGFEIDTGKLKIGNGTTPWNDLPYLGEDKALIINANTHYDFPAIGDVDIIYKASQENQLYQWNNDTYNYELLLPNNLVTQEQLQEAIDKIEIPEMVLEDYATKAYAQELFNQLIPLDKAEILEICN